MEKTYNGGKSGSGVYQKIINQIPPHELYIEAFAGNYSIGRHKRPAVASIAIEIDAEQCWKLIELNLAGTTIVNGDTISLLKSTIAKSSVPSEKIFVYLDPPYLFETRSSKRPIYDHEFGNADQHQALLELIKTLECNVAISGYWSELYERELAGWRSITFNTVVRSGDTREEWLWMNYPEPIALHDYSYLGDNFRERERIKRKVSRWKAKLEKMDVLERRAILMAIQSAGSIATKSEPGEKKS